jgi:CRP/FNR family transcriptional regulator
MRSAYNLEFIEDCLTCPFREERIFCNLSPTGVKKLSSIISTAVYPKGVILFVEGQAPRGVFIICSGRVKLSASSAEGKSLILKIAEPGEVLGLSATISGKPYMLTAEVQAPAQANFVGRADFLDFLREHGDAALRVAQLLSENYHRALEEIRTIGLSRSAAEKLAKFLLDSSAGQDEKTGEIRLKLAFTHEEIAEMIGTSRETVTRLFADFKRRQLVQVKGSTLVIRKKAELRSLVGS